MSPRQAWRTENQNTSTFFFRPTGGPRRGARTTAFFSGVKSWWREGSEQGPPAARRLAPTRGADCLLTWSLVFSDSDELSEFSSSDGDMLAWSRSLDAFRARLEADICKRSSPNPSAPEAHALGRAVCPDPSQAGAKLQEPLWGQQRPF